MQLAIFGDRRRDRRFRRVVSRPLSLVIAALVTIGAAKPSPIERAMAAYEAAHPGVRRSGGNVTRPELLAHEQPLFPPEALARRRAGGMILLEAVVDERGFLKDPVILNRAQPDLQPYVLKSLRTWRYKPATFKGKPVPVFLVLTTNIHVQ